MDVLTSIANPRTFAIAVMLLACWCAPLFAQPSERLDEIVDAGDLWRAIRHKPRVPADVSQDESRMFVIAPIIGTKPDFGVQFGAAGNIAFYHGDRSTTHISTAVFSATISTGGQVLSNMRFGTFTNGDRWLISGDNRFQWTSQKTFGLGTSTLPAGAVNARYDFFRVRDTVYHRFARDMFLGGGVFFDTHQNIRPGEDEEDVWDSSPSVTYSNAHGLPTESATSGGIGAAARFDSRDSQIDARRGWFASASYAAFFKGFLGGDSTWHKIDFDIRRYRAIGSSGRHRLAAWFFGDAVVSGVAPYFDLPAIGMDTFGRSGRGYAEGRFRGDQLVYGELEYRTTLTANGFLGMVAFLNGTTVSNAETGERLFHMVAPGAGLGARLLLNKRSRTNLCFDVGFGKDGSRAIYLAVQEVF
jgi:hypothetical protein